MPNIAEVRQRRWLLAGLLLSAVLLISGLILPVLSVEHFWIWSESISVLGGVWQLFQAGQLVLFVIVGFFSVCLPLAKLILLIRIVLSRAPRRHPILQKLLSRLHDWGRWAMLDVLVIAVLIVVVKSGAAVQVHVKPGLYLFSAAVLLIMLLTGRVRRFVS